MSKDEFKKICELDDIIDQEGGLGLDPFGNARYDYRAIIKHAKERNIDPIDMTVRELGQFVIGA
ncbi:MAG: hypothetical protein LBC86_06625 [Oscillospiraceae bacterium]|jgi:hypothetical protein|nr:hypothetical protein [Oscillospiraceae bacterium]